MTTSHEDTLREQRQSKLDELTRAGYRAYANDFKPELTCTEVHERHQGDSTESLQGSTKIYIVAGRIVSLRRHGKSTFFNLQDRTGVLQIFVKQDTIGEAAYGHLKLFDLGDIVGVAGTPMRTRTGELTLAAEGLRILTKSLQPPPEKWHGLTDVEQRYRRRYVDLIANPAAREIFRRRAAIISGIRQFLDVREFLEVETPILQDVAGGASAQPFVTHHNALGQDLYLRIATELHLKRLVVGGLERVYEIGRCFRNEGLSKKHNPEFTSLELYQAYATAEDLILLTEELLNRLATRVAGDEVVEFGEHRISFARPFTRIAMADAVGQHLGVGPLRSIDSASRAGELVFEHCLDTDPIDAILQNLDDDELSTLVPGASGDNPAALVKSARAAYLADPDRKTALTRLCGRLDEALSPDRRRALALHLLYACFDHEVEATLIQPTFITDYPLPASPLARQHDADPAVVDRFEFFAAGMELANAFSELNDPMEQRRRFEDQVRLKRRGDEEAPDMDEDFVRALEVGMPPTAGEGIGIDRLTMVLCNAATIREVILFPQLRRMESGDDEAATIDTPTE
ncbi:MAG: lysine--tRNA ligase [Pseudomonadota bacterium]